MIAIDELPLADTLARPLRDLRISVTDRCQFRCAYCMPREVFGRDFAFLPRACGGVVIVLVTPFGWRRCSRST